MVCLFVSGWAQSPADSLPRRYVIPVIMPFCARQINQNPDYKHANIGNACREYYQGLLLAADSLKRKGMNIKLSVFDSEKDSLRFIKILKKEDVQQADLIFGPVTKEGELAMIPFSEQRRRFHISPLFTFTKTVINDSFMISANPDLSYYSDYLFQYLTNHAGTCNLIVLNGKTAVDKVMGHRLKELSKAGSGISVKIMDIARYAEVKDSYQDDRPNYVLVTSDEEFLINRAIGKIIDSSGVFEVHTLGLRSWLSFKNINQGLWQQAKVTVITPFWVDYKRPLVQRFVTEYRETYHTEPSEFAFQGYDQFLYYMLLVEATKGELEKIDRQPPLRLLCNTYETGKKKNSKGWQNMHLVLLRFEDETLKILK